MIYRPEIFSLEAIVEIMKNNNKRGEIKIGYSSLTL